MEPNRGELQARAVQMRQQLYEDWHRLYIVAHGPRLPGTTSDISAAQARMAEIDHIIKHLEDTYIPKENTQ